MHSSMRWVISTSWGSAGRAGEVMELIQDKQAAIWKAATAGDLAACESSCSMLRTQSRVRPDRCTIDIPLRILRCQTPNPDKVRASGFVISPNALFKNVMSISMHLHVNTVALGDCNQL